jgi:hypothetical protein
MQYTLVNIGNDAGNKSNNIKGGRGQNVLASQDVQQQQKVSVFASGDQVLENVIDFAESVYGIANGKLVGES